MEGDWTYSPLHTSASESRAQAGRVKASSRLCTCSGGSQWGLHSIPTSNPGSSPPFLADPLRPGTDPAWGPSHPRPGPRSLPKPLPPAPRGSLGAGVTLACPCLSAPRARAPTGGGAEPGRVSLSPAACTRKEHDGRICGLQGSDRMPGLPK